MLETINPKSAKAAWPYGATLEEAMRTARDEVRRLYAILSHCEPDAERLELTAAALAEGRVVASDIVSALVSSSGFDLRQVVPALGHDEEVVAFENVVQNAYRLLLLRDADESALRAFSSALVGGELTVLGMVAELMNTEEFSNRGAPSEADMPSLNLVVQDVFNLLMSRDADELALQAFSGALASGELTILDMVRELLNSTEFGSSALRLPSVSRHVVSSVIRTMMRRDSDEATLDAYVNSLRSGTELNAFLNEMLSSPEFHKLTQGPASGAAAVATVQDVFNLLMSRDADESALQAFSGALASGELTILDTVRELLNSTEFGSSALRLPSVSRHVVFSVIRTMMQRDVDEDTLDAYVNSLKSGTELNAFLNEMLSSPEFHKLMKGPNSGTAATATGVPAELAQLAEGLLVTQMVSEGCCIAAAPYSSSIRYIASEKQIAALLRTFAMLGQKPPTHSESGHQ